MAKTSNEPADKWRQITIRVTDEEYAEFRKAAISYGLPLATWMKLVCRAAAGLPVPGQDM